MLRRARSRFPVTFRAGPADGTGHGHDLLDGDWGVNAALKRGDAQRYCLGGWDHDRRRFGSSGITHLRAADVHGRSQALWPPSSVGQFALAFRKPPLLAGNWPKGITRTSRSHSRILPARAAAARLQRLRLLPLGRRSGRRNRRSGAEPGPAGLVGRPTAPVLCRPGRSIPCSSPWNETIREFGIPCEPFCNLLTAFRQDQRVTRYETFEGLAGLLPGVGRSSGAVGALSRPLAIRPKRVQLSDRICTGLQLANFWQDVARGLGQGADLSALGRLPGSLTTRKRPSRGASRATPFDACWPSKWSGADTFLRGRSAAGLGHASRAEAAGGVVRPRRIGYAKGHPAARLRRVEPVGRPFRNLTSCGCWSAAGGIHDDVVPRRDRRELRLLPTDVPAGGSNLSLGVPAARLASSVAPMEALYAFMRHTDDLADDLPFDLRRDALAAWRKSLQEVLRSESEIRDLKSEIRNPILPALADAVRRFQYPQRAP